MGITFLQVVLPDSFLELGGDRDVAVEYLSTSYAGIPKMINLLIQWLQIAGCKQKEIQAMVEEHFTSVILKHFDPKKADHVLVEGGEVRGRGYFATAHVNVQNVVYI